MGSPETDLHRHLSEQRAIEGKEDFIQQKADELYLGEFSPEREDNFAEFLGNMPAPLLRELMAAMKACNGGQSNELEVVAILNDGAMTYWKESAKACVKRRLADGYYEGKAA